MSTRPLTTWTSGRSQVGLRTYACRTYLRDSRYVSPSPISPLWLLQPISPPPSTHTHTHTHRPNRPPQTTYLAGSVSRITFLLHRAFFFFSFCRRRHVSVVLRCVCVANVSGFGLSGVGWICRAHHRLRDPQEQTHVIYCTSLPPPPPTLSCLRSRTQGPRRSQQVFRLKVCLGKETWRIYKTYTDFKDMHTQVRAPDTSWPCAVVLCVCAQFVGFLSFPISCERD